MLSVFSLLLVCFAVGNARFVEQFEKFYEEKNTDPTFNGKIWVLLVAGSQGYFNYRHQADVCHAYQVVHNHGIPDEQIVVMMQDDIAQNSENPRKGVIINHPDGPDVYHGVPKDYTGKDVTPKNFLNIMKGNKEAMHGIGSGKTIMSTSNDHVFVFFADHGAPGLIAFPTSQLYQKDLTAAIKQMSDANVYKQLVFYVEACESGSMFENVLPANINVYATTAANSHESSYACYYDSKLETYLGDRYSVNWLEDSDKENLDTESMHKQFKIVKQETNQSHVMQYGNISMSYETVGLFQGQKKSMLSYMPLRKIYDDVPSPDVPLYILKNRIEAATDIKKKLALELELQKEIEMRRRITWTASTIAKQVTAGNKDLVTLVTTQMPSLNEFECYQKATNLFNTACFGFEKYEYAIRQLYVLGNLCDAGVPTDSILEAIRSTCM